MDEDSNVSVPREVDIIAKTIKPPIYCTGINAENSIEETYNEIKQIIQPFLHKKNVTCLLYTSPSPRDRG